MNEAPTKQRRVDSSDEAKGHLDQASQGEATARQAGRGGLAIAGAKIAFILLGFVQQLVLPRLVGVEGYGQVSRVLAVVSIVNNVIVATSIQGVSRVVASAPAGREGQAFRATLQIHAALALLVSVAFASIASWVAQAMEAPHITTPLRLVAAVVLLYGVYAPLVGSLNGRRRFLTQAGLDTVYGVLRTTGIVGGAWVFTQAGRNGVLGAFAGFVSAAFVIVPLALQKSGTGRSGTGGPGATEYLRFLLPLMMGQLFLNLLMQTDSLLLSRFAGQAARDMATADMLQGVYRAVQLFSFLPYQLLMSVTFILFPMLARAQADGDRAAVRVYTMTGVRLALLLTVLMTGVVSGIAPHLLRFAFPEDIWTRGGPVLRVLSLGMGSFSILGIECAALTSLGRARESALLTLAGVVLVATGCSLVVPSAALGTAMLLSSAVATSTALTVVAVAGAIRVSMVAGGFAALPTLVRVVAALGACLAVGSRLPWAGKLAVPLEAALVGAVGVGVLLLLRELGKADRERLRQVLGSRRPS